MVKFKHFKRDGHEDVCEIFSLFWRDAKFFNQIYYIKIYSYLT